MQTLIEIVLPFPPSANLLHRRVGRRTLLSRKGRVYRDKVRRDIAAMGVEPLQGRLEVSIDVFPPDRRKRDLDNLPKNIFDSLQHGGAFKDDSQIDDVRIIRREPVPRGRVIVHIREMQC